MLDFLVVRLISQTEYLRGQWLKSTLAAIGALLHELEYSCTNVFMVSPGELCRWIKRSGTNILWASIGNKVQSALGIAADGHRFKATLVQWPILLMFYDRNLRS